MQLLRRLFFKTSNKPQPWQLSSVLVCIPIFWALFVWFSSLAFVPVPWPDDSAFYFVAKALFSWPPRWVMLPQAPFEPTYRIFNFNTMPLYPIVIGLGRMIGIDGSFLLKLWPLSAWALTGSYFVACLYRLRLPFILCLIWVAAFTFDPELRWASVLIRPESLIGLLGIILVSGLSFGFPARFKSSRFWDPVAALLTVAAYCHFNAIHLVFPVVFAFVRAPRRCFEIGWKTTLYLSPWLLAVLLHWEIFKTQMAVQWNRLSVFNSWLTTPYLAIGSLFQNLGSPEPWPRVLAWAALGMWGLLFSGLIVFLFLLVSELNQVLKTRWKFEAFPKSQDSLSVSIAPAIGWLLGAVWLWDTKPEVWFMYYLHLAIWFFAGVAAVQLWRSSGKLRSWALGILILNLTGMAGIFLYVDLSQAYRLGKTQSWHWDTYGEFVSCLDKQLVELRNKKGPDQPFLVWNPTFPDVTIELSRKHPDWEFTRTNDFSTRQALAIGHGWEADAVVVTEFFSNDERSISAKAEDVSLIQSGWMQWKPYFLNTLWTTDGWKPNRYVCQRGRWQGFLFMNRR